MWEAETKDMTFICNMGGDKAAGNSAAAEVDVLKTI